MFSSPTGHERHLRAIARRDQADTLTVHMAKAMDHPIRRAILDAIGGGPKSATQLHATYPHASLPSIWQQINRLLELGCIEEVFQGEQLGPQRRVFEIARGSFFDKSSLEALGDAATRGAPGATARNYSQRIDDALKAGTFGAQADTQFLSTSGYLDEQGWNSVIAAIDALFWRSLHLRLEAIPRLRESGEQPITVTTGFACFVSPVVTSDLSPIPVIRFGSPGSHPSAKSSTPSTVLTAALTHPVRVVIVRALKRGPASPSEVRNVAPVASMQSFSRHFKRLEELKCIEKVEDRSGGWTSRNRYRLSKNISGKSSLYGALPPSMRGDIDSVYISDYFDRLAEAIEAGMFEARPESHHTWTGLLYDRQAWTELTSEIDQVFEYALQMYGQADARQAAAREAGVSIKALIPVTFSLGCFESPEGAWTLEDEKLESLLEQEAPSRAVLDRYRGLIAWGAGTEAA